MYRRVLPTILGSALIAAASVNVPASARTPGEVPQMVQIIDPAGDANYLNGQGDPGQGDRPTPADLSVSDILSVWFTNDAKTISVHVQTELPPPSANAAYLYRVEVNPGPDNDDGCLWFEAAVGGPTFIGEPFGIMRDTCAGDSIVFGELAIIEAADGTGIVSVTLPRSAHSAFADGAVIADPWAQVRNHLEAGGRGAYPGVVDDTKIGEDYIIVRPTKHGKGRKRG